MARMYDGPEDFPREELEFRSAWSAAAGCLDGITRCLVMVRRDAGNAYMCGQDALAESLRRLSRNIQQMESEASLELQAFINEGDRRRTAKTEGHQ